MSDWSRLQTTKAFLETLSLHMGIPALDVVQSQHGGHGHCTWIRREGDGLDLSVHFQFILNLSISVWAFTASVDVCQAHHMVPTKAYARTGPSSHVCHRW